MTEKQPTLVRVRHESYEQAFTVAAQEAATTMATIAPAIVYRQGNRDIITTAFPMRYVAERVRIDNLARGGNASEHYNRPLIPEHSRAITEYIVTQDDYVLPSVSLCVGQPLRCHTTRSSSAVRMGVLVIPTSIMYNITDGQHRAKGIRDAIPQKESLADDGIGITLVVESDLEKVHQLFFDCAQTRSIAPSLLTMYNKRDHLAKLVRDICDQVPVFAGRIEQVSKTVGKSSINIFTLNQVRVAVAELVTGDSTQNSISLRRDTQQRLADPQALAEHMGWVVDFFNGFTLANPQWSEVLGAGNPALGTVDTDVLRHRYVHFTGTGLIVLGKLGYAIRKQPATARERLVELLGRRIDWSRDAGIWDGNIVINGRMNTQRTPVDLAVIRVKEQLRMPISEQELRRAQRGSAK